MEMTNTLSAAIRVLRQATNDGGPRLINPAEAADLLSALPDALVTSATLPDQPGATALLTGDGSEYRAILIRHRDGGNRWHDLADGQELRTDWVTSWQPLDLKVRPSRLTSTELDEAFSSVINATYLERVTAWINTRMGAHS